MTNSANFDAIDEHGTAVTGANQTLSAKANALGSRANTARAKYFVALMDLNVVIESNNDLKARLFSAIGQLKQYILELKSQKINAVASVKSTFPVEIRDLPEMQGVIAQDAASKGSEYDQIISVLTQKEAQLTELLQGTVNKNGELFVQAQGVAQRGLKAVERLIVRQAGYAYIALRMDSYVKAIHNYSTSGRTNETTAIAGFHTALEWHGTSDGIKADKGLAAYAEARRAAEIPDTLQHIGAHAPIRAISFSDSPDKFEQYGGASYDTRSGEELNERLHGLKNELSSGASTPMRLEEINTEIKEINGYLGALGYRVNLDTATPPPTDPS